MLTCTVLMTPRLPRCALEVARLQQLVSQMAGGGGGSGSAVAGVGLLVLPAD